MDAVGGDGRPELARAQNEARGEPASHAGTGGTSNEYFRSVFLLTIDYFYFFTDVFLLWFQRAHGFELRTLYVTTARSEAICKEHANQNLRLRRETRRVGKVEEEVEVEDEGEDGENEGDEELLHQSELTVFTQRQLLSWSKLDDCLVDMEVDTSASISLISEAP